MKKLELDNIRFRDLLTDFGEVYVGMCEGNVHTEAYLCKNEAQKIVDYLTDLFGFDGKDTD